MATEYRASVVDQKFVAKFGEQSAPVPRRADEGISGIFRGGATPARASRAGEYCDELLVQDTSTGLQRVGCPPGTWIALAVALCMAACGSSSDGNGGQPVFERLSQYGYFLGPLDEQVPRADLFAYEVGSQLFSDDTSKRRFILLPPDGTIDYHDTDAWVFPVGTTIIKTFSMRADHRLEDGDERFIETRLLVKEADAWRPRVYLWDDDQREAMRIDIGARIPLQWIDADGVAQSEEYLVPNTNQCGNCHGAGDDMAPLGPRTRQLGGERPLGDQIDNMAALAMFSAPPPPAAQREIMPDPFGDAPLDLRARSYLDANCGHCHRPSATQAAAATGLDLDWQSAGGTAIGICKRPTQAGRGSGGRLFDIVPGNPDESVLVFRMASTDPEIKMPEIPTRRSDARGVALISEWIASLPADDCR